jgi:hypothetical protein
MSRFAKNEPNSVQELTESELDAVAGARRTTLLSGLSSAGDRFDARAIEVVKALQR